MRQYNGKFATLGIPGDYAIALSLDYCYQLRAALSRSRDYVTHHYNDLCRSNSVYNLESSLLDILNDSLTPLDEICVGK